MKQADAPLIAYLQECVALRMDELPYCELFTLTLTSGDVLAYTDWDSDVVVSATRFIGNGLVIPQRGSISSKVGTEVETMDLDFHLGQDDDGNFATPLRGMTMQMLAAAGWLDQAQVLVQRLFWKSGDGIGSAAQLTAPWAPVYKFSGLVAKPSTIQRMLVSLDCVAWTQRLQRQVPNTIMDPACPYQIYDQRCGVNMADYAVNCVAGILSTQIILQAEELVQADRYFDNGFVVFTSGANSGLAAAIKTYTATNGIRLDAPLLAPIAAGDTFIAYPGCDFTNATCAAKFDNANRYGGWSYVPTPETAFL